MDASTQDLLLVGGGAVGLRTAVAATELNAKLNIAVISTVRPMRPRAVQNAARERNPRTRVSRMTWLCSGCS